MIFLKIVITNFDFAKEIRECLCCRSGQLFISLTVKHLPGEWDKRRESIFSSFNHILSFHLAYSISLISFQIIGSLESQRSVIIE